VKRTSFALLTSLLVVAWLSIAATISGLLIVVPDDPNGKHPCDFKGKMALTPDAFYVCTTTGNISTAVWTAASDIAPFSGSDPFWAACSPVPATPAEALECLAELKADLEDMVSVTQSTGAPVGNCTGSPQCIHFDTDVAGEVVEGLYCGLEGEAFGTCFPGASVSVSNTAPNGAVTCTPGSNGICIHYEADTEILWVSDNSGDSSWRAIFTNSVTTFLKYVILNFDTSGDGTNECAAIATGGATNACDTIGSTTFTSFDASGHMLPVGPVVVERLTCRIVALAGDETTDSIDIVPYMRNGVDASVATTARITVPTGQADGTYLSTAINESLALTTGAMFLRVDENDGGGAGSSITDFDADCVMVVRTPR
jgi:hypothetical protein